MPREKQQQPAIVHGYQTPDKERPEITGAETVAWYVEPDAHQQASKLAGGRNVALPYFFCGNPPAEGKAWPKHRRGGLAFVRNWLAAHAGDKLDRDATAGAKGSLKEAVDRARTLQEEVDAAGAGESAAVTAKKPGLKAAAQKAADAKPGNGPQPTDAETVEALQLSHAKLEKQYRESSAMVDELTEKLKGERATARGLRKAMKEAEGGLRQELEKSAKLEDRVTTQQTILQDMDATVREQRLALRRILDRAQVASRVVDRLPLAIDLSVRRRDHALAELKSIRELAKEMIPNTNEAQRDAETYALTVMDNERRAVSPELANVDAAVARAAGITDGDAG